MYRYLRSVLSHRGFAVGGSGIFLAGLGASDRSFCATSKAPRPIVLVGPSGSGKGTLVGILQKNHPDAFGFSVSHTTRPPRPGEVDGVNYHFTNRDHMQKEIDQGKFLEFADVHGKFYGTSFKSVRDVAANGQV